MREIEIAYNILNDLLIERLPDYITKINHEHNDGIVLTNFNNSRVSKKTLPFPYFTLEFVSSEREEKDILIENVVLLFSVSIHINESDENYNVRLWRYFSAVGDLINDVGDFQHCGVEGIGKNKIKIKTTI